MHGKNASQSLASETPPSNIPYTYTKTHTHSPVPCYLTRASWQPHLSYRLYLRRSSVRLHQGLLQALAHVANQGRCRLNYVSTSCGQNEEKHMRRCRWFNEHIKHISTLTIKRLHRHLQAKEFSSRISLKPAHQGFSFFFALSLFPWGDVSVSLRPGSLPEIRTGKAFSLSAIHEGCFLTGLCGNHNTVGLTSSL